jgi:hypothetical protein
MDYTIPLIGFFAAVLAVRGSTWQEGKPGLRALTKTGWMTIVLATIALGVSLALTTTARRASAATEIRSTATFANTKATRDSIQLLQRHLAAANAGIDTANQKLEAASIRLGVYEQVLTTLRSQSERQPQQVMTQFVELDGGQWHAPNSIFAGSVVKLYGFGCEVTLLYGGREEVIYARPQQPPEVMVIGAPGVPMRWALRSNEVCGGKVQVTSTPRGRSIDWSWVEERIAQ